MRDVVDIFKDEVLRTFRMLGKDGLEQNAADIKRWREEGRISDKEYQALRSFNRRAFSFVGG